MRVSKCERGSCDYCMEMRNKIRTVDEANVSVVAEQWGTNLLQAVQSIDVHNNCRKKSQVPMEHFMVTRPRLKEAHISFDMLVFVPKFAAGTTADFFKMKQGLDVSMFGF